MFLESFGLLCDSASCEQFYRLYPHNHCSPRGWVTGPMGDCCPLHALHPNYRSERTGAYHMISYKKLHSNLLLVTFRLLTKQGLRPSQIMARIVELQTGPSGEPANPVEANWLKAITSVLAAELGEGDAAPDEDDTPIGEPTEDSDDSLAFGDDDDTAAMAAALPSSPKVTPKSATPVRRGAPG